MVGPVAVTQVGEGSQKVPGVAALGLQPDEGFPQRRRRPILWGLSSILMGGVARRRERS